MPVKVDAARRGVGFRVTPLTMGYGGSETVSEDECGNLLNLHQD